MSKRTKTERARVARYTANILRTYHAAPRNVRIRSADWYLIESDKLAELALELGLPVRAVCGAAAAISPGMRWELVPGYVHALATAEDWTTLRVPTYSSLFVARAMACLRGEEQPLDVLGGPKVRAFYALLESRGQSDAVVIDGHAFNIARGKRAPIRGANVPKAARVGAKQYREASAAYNAAAKALDIPAHAVQAITWVYWRAEA